MLGTCVFLLSHLTMTLQMWVISSMTTNDKEKKWEADFLQKADFPPSTIYTMSYQAVW